MAANDASTKDLAIRTPEVYGTSKAYRMGLGTILALLALGALGFAVYGLVGGDFHSWTQRAIICVSCLAVALLVSAGLVSTFRYRIEVCSDRLVRKGAFGSREMRLEAIAGIRTIQTKNSRTLVFLPKDPGGKKIKINLMMPRSKEFQAWARGNFRDLDAEEREADLRKILADESLGGDAETRGRKYRFAMRLTRLVNGAGTVALLWAFFYPSPYEVVIWILISLPFAAFATASMFPDLVRFNGPPKGAYPILSPVVTLAAIGLALRAFIDRDILAWDRFWTPFTIVSGLLFASLLLRFPEIRRKPRNALFPIILAAAYGYGATISYNCLEDHARAKKYRAEVEEKWASHGKTTTYYLKLSPWGPRSVPKDVTVSESAYAQAQRGDSVSVWLRNGALGIPWFTVQVD
ncbi:MAG: hypothetical protein JF616_01910 [Fibrobacteres bacterium]|nr:hypothetical protein [Fibrobacterota bacterium]